MAAFRYRRHLSDWTHHHFLRVRPTQKKTTRFQRLCCQIQETDSRHRSRCALWPVHSFSAAAAGSGAAAVRRLWGAHCGEWWGLQAVACRAWTQIVPATVAAARNLGVCRLAAAAALAACTVPLQC